ncbi:MAG: N-acetylmuramoyl-L-alanine amidase [Fimbriimonas sp.]
MFGTVAAFGVLGILSQGVQDPRISIPNPWKEPGYLNLVWIQSPNFGRRPEGTVVDTIVLHHTVIDTLETTTKAFLRESSQVSAHYTVGRDGSIVQHVSSFDRAWHAGVSVDYRGKENLNHYSVGIEMVNLGDGKDPWPEAQVRAVACLIFSLKQRFPIVQITSHEFIARPIGRKNDPLGFPWEKLKWLDLPMHYGQAK